MVVDRSIERFVCAPTKNQTVKSECINAIQSQTGADLAFSLLRATCWVPCWRSRSHRVLGQSNGPLQIFRNTLVQTKNVAAINQCIRRNQCRGDVDQKKNDRRLCSHRPRQKQGSDPRRNVNKRNDPDVQQMQVILHSCLPCSSL